MFVDDYDHEAADLCGSNKSPDLVRFARKCINHGRETRRENDEIRNFQICVIDLCAFLNVPKDAAPWNVAVKDAIGRLIAERNEWKARAESAEDAIRERNDEDARGPVL